MIGGPTARRSSLSWDSPLGEPSFPDLTWADTFLESHGCNYTFGFSPTVARGREKALQRFSEDERLPWQEQSLCAYVDPDVFFPEKGGSSREAKRICAQCTVQVECLEYALANDERFGIWGGLSERERRRLKRLAS